MTDEEKARALARDLQWRMDNDGGVWDDLPGAMKDIAAAFAAVREECAKVVEERSRQYECCKAIAKAIRTGPSRPSEGEG